VLFLREVPWGLTEYCAGYMLPNDEVGDTPSGFAVSLTDSIERDGSRRYEASHFHAYH
jgi:hypothetical protein